MLKKIVIVCALCFPIAAPALGQGGIKNSHSVDSIRTAMSSAIPPYVQQQAQQFDANLIATRKWDNINVAILSDSRHYRVAQIVEKLLVALGDTSRWTVRVLDTNPKIENAFTVGGPYIYVLTGLIDNAQSDDELAFVLGHEIAHAKLKHNLRSSEDFSKLLASLIELSGSMSKTENRRDKMELIGGSIKSLYSREDEREADALGAYIANKASFDASRGITFFTRAIKREQASNTQNEAQIAQSRANVQQQIANCEALQAQWNSMPKSRTPQNAQIVNSTCQTAQTNSERFNSSVTKYQLGSVLLRSHPVDNDRISALFATTQYLKGSRSLQSLSGIGQGYNVFVAMRLETTPTIAQNNRAPSPATASPTTAGVVNPDSSIQATQNSVQPKDVEFVRLYRLSADQGNAQGQVNLGLMYALGRGGLPKDDVEAARLYRLSADQGNALAQVNLGNMYALGRGGLPKDEVEAERLFKLSAEKNNSSGQFFLGQYHEYGRGGLAKDIQTAIYWYGLAAQQGYPLAITALKRLEK